MGFINQLITGGPHIVGFILFTMGYAPLGFADLADGLRWEFETHNNTDLGHVEQSMDPILGVYKNHTDSIMYLKYRCIYMYIYIYVCVTVMYIICRWGIDVNRTWWNTTSDLPMKPGRSLGHQYMRNSWWFHADYNGKIQLFKMVMTWGWFMALFYPHYMVWSYSV